MKKSTAWLALIAMLVAACGTADGGDDAGSDSTQGSVADTSAPDSTEAPDETTEDPGTTEASGEPVTLEVWDWRSFGEDAPHAQVFERVNADFEEAYPNIDVEFTALPFEGYEARLRTAAATQDGPDVFLSDNWGDEYYDIIVPVSELVTDEQREQVLSIDERVSGRYDETLVMPYGLNANIILYNKSLFEEAGLDPENPPATLDEMLEACDTLNEAGIVPMSVGLQDGWWIAFFHIIFGAQTLEEEKARANQADEMPLTDEAYRTPLEATIQMYERGCFGEDALSKTSGDTYPDLDAGLTAMRPDNRVPTELLEALGEENVGFMLYPRLPESEYDHDVTSAGAHSVWAVTKWAPVEEAWDYITFLTDPHGQEILWEETHIAPNNTEVDTSSLARNPLEEQYLTLLLETPGIVKYGAFPGTTEGSYENYVALAPEVLAGNMSVDDFLEALEEYRLQNLEDAG